MEEFYIDCDGIRLHSKLDKPQGKDKCPLCILIHGFSGHMEEPHIIVRLFHFRENVHVAGNK